MRPFCEHYEELLRQLLESPAEANARTGTRVRVLPGAASFTLDLSDRVLPTAGLRRVYPRVAAAETAWYVSGEQDATWMRRHAAIWDKFVEPLTVHPSGHPRDEPPASATLLTADTVDGKERSLGYRFKGVKAAYGYRWRRHFGRDQLRLAVDALRRDPSDRRVAVSAWDPSEDGLGAPGQLNVPCPAMFTLCVVGGRLNSTMLLRSSDVFVGLPYDVMGHALLMDALAVELGLAVGQATFALAHAHLYDCHWDMATIACTQVPTVPPMVLPGWSLSAIEDDRDAYVAAVAEASGRHAWPPYVPRPEVVA